MLRPGQCRWCKCTYEKPCPGSCGWADRDQTLCTECVPIERAWNQLRKGERKPNMYRAFFRGFVNGAEDERSIDDAGVNPYAAGQTSTYFDKGYRADVKAIADARAGV